MPCKRKKDNLQKDEDICIIHSTSVKEKKLVKATSVSFEKIKEVAKLRLNQPLSSPHRKADICEQIPVEQKEYHSFHRKCYQIFTNRSHNLQVKTESDKTCPQTHKSQNTDDKCIFCENTTSKYVKRNNIWTKEPLSSFMLSGLASVSGMAEEKGDKNLLSDIENSSDPKYHKSCREKYVQKPELGRTLDTEKKEKQSELEIAHMNAFECILKEINEQVLVKNQILKLKYL